MSVGARYMQWIQIKESMDPNALGHDYVQSPNLLQFPTKPIFIAEGIFTKSMGIFGSREKLDGNHHSNPDAFDVAFSCPVPMQGSRLYLKGK